MSQNDLVRQREAVSKTYGSEASDELCSRLRSARSICVLTGAGMSVESGLATFRDPGGLWDTYRPEELANEAAFRRNPALVQGWYDARRRQALDAEPNPGHRALAKLENSVEEFTLVTQNVDGLHQRAGSENIIEIHGNIVDELCIECGRPADGTEAAPGDDALRRCRSCEGLLRPGVVWFGEMLPEGAFSRAAQAAAAADVFLSVGTSSVVYPAAELPHIAGNSGSYVVEVNVEPSAAANSMSEVLVGPAGSILPELAALLIQSQDS